MCITASKRICKCNLFMTGEEGHQKNKLLISWPSMIFKRNFRRVFSSEGLYLSWILQAVLGTPCIFQSSQNSKTVMSYMKTFTAAFLYNLQKWILLHINFLNCLRVLQTGSYNPLMQFHTTLCHIVYDKVCT